MRVLGILPMTHGELLAPPSGARGTVQEMELALCAECGEEIRRAERYWLVVTDSALDPGYRLCEGCHASGEGVPEPSWADA